MKFSKHRDFPTPQPYGFTRQCLALYEGRAAVALTHDRQLWRLSLAAPAGQVLDLREWSPRYQQWRQTAATTIEERTYGGGALFAYRQGFGVVFLDQVLLFATVDQPVPQVLEILGPDQRPQQLPERFLDRAGCPGSACWLPATNELAVAYEHGQFYGRQQFLGLLLWRPAAGLRPAAYYLAAPPRPLALSTELSARQALPPGLGQQLDAPQLLALRYAAGQLQVATFGGPYSARLGGGAVGLALLAVAPRTATATALVQHVPTRWGGIRFSPDGQLVGWNQYSPAPQGGLYFYNLVTTETTRLGFRQKAFTTGLQHGRGELLRGLGFDRAGRFVWVFSCYGCSVFEIQ